MDKSKIEHEAKEILEKFAKTLNKVKVSEDDFGVDREEFEREEGSIGVVCEEFKEDLLLNAPKKDENFIIAEKGDFGE